MISIKAPAPAARTIDPKALADSWLERYKQILTDHGRARSADARHALYQEGRIAYTNYQAFLTISKLGPSWMPGKRMR